MIRLFVRLAHMLTLCTAASPLAAQGRGPVDYVEAWRAHSAHLAHATGRFKSEYVREQGGKKSVQTAEETFAFTPTARRQESVVRDADMKSPWHKLICANSKYAFRLDRQERGWLLERMGVGDDEQAKWAQSDLVNNLRPAFALTSVYGVPLVDLAGDLKADAAAPRTLTLTRERQFAVGRKTVTFRRLSLQLDDNKYSTLKSATVDLKMNVTPGSATVTCEHEVVSGVPVPVRLVESATYSVPNGVLKLANDVTIDLDPSADPPESDFTLTAFGLPEPVGVEWRRPTPVYVWLLAAAAAFGVAAVLFRNLRGRGERVRGAT